MNRVSLDYAVTRELDLPDAAYNADGIATLVLTGASYGGMWMMSAIVLGDDEPSGSIETAEAPRRPDLALDAAEDWVGRECARLGVALRLCVSKNDQYGPDEAPFFSTGLALVDREPTP